MWVWCAVRFVCRGALRRPLLVVAGTVVQNSTPTRDPLLVASCSLPCVAQALLAIGVCCFVTNEKKVTPGVLSLCEVLFSGLRTTPAVREQALLSWALVAALGVGSVAEAEVCIARYITDCSRWHLRVGVGATIHGRYTAVRHVGDVG